MHEFKSPYYEGPDCVCCKHLKEDVVNDIIAMLNKQDSVCADWAIALIEEDYK